MGELELLWRVPAAATVDDVTAYLAERPVLAVVHIFDAQMDNDGVDALAVDDGRSSAIRSTRAQLRVLDVGSTKEPQASIPAVAQGCPQLQYLDVNNARVSFASITAVEQRCPQLQRLSVKCIPLTYSPIAAMAQDCPPLSHLNVSNTQVTDASITAVAQRCPQLQHLEVSRTRVTDASITALAQGCPRLEHLDVWGTGVTDLSITAVAQRCPRLQYLGVWWTKVTDASITAVAEGCPHLQHLIAGLSPEVLGVTDASITALARGCPELRHLGVRSADVADSSITVVARSCPQLQHLDVWCTTVTDSSITAVAQGCPQLQHLNVGRIDVMNDQSLEFGVSHMGVTDASITAVAQGCPQLRELNVSHTSVTDASITAVAQGCPQLRELNVSHTSVTDASITAVAQGCPQLRELNVSHTSVTDASITAVAQGCPQLRELNVSHTSVTDASITAVAQGCPQLRELNVSHTSVTDASITAVAQGCPQLHDLDVRDTKVTDAVARLTSQRSTGASASPAEIRLSQAQVFGFARIVARIAIGRVKASSANTAAATPVPCHQTKHPFVSQPSALCDQIRTIVAVSHAGSGRRTLLRTVFPDAVWPSRHGERSITVAFELVPSNEALRAQARFSATRETASSVANAWVDAWGSDWGNVPTTNGDAHQEWLDWCDVAATNDEALQEWLDQCVSQWHDFRDVAATPADDGALRMHVRVYGPSFPRVRLVLPPPYYATGTPAGARTLAEIQAVVREEAAADPTAHFLWAFPAPADPANSSVRQDIIAACGVAERTTGVMTKCDLVTGEFDASPAAIIAAKLRTLREGEPALGGGWIAMANACSVKEATAAWEAAGSPAGQLERFKQENTLARERATFDQLLRGAATDQGDRVSPNDAFGAAALHDHIQVVFDGNAKRMNVAQEP